MKALLLMLMVSPVAWADQKAPQLDTLFEALTTAEDAAERRVIEGEIWQHWMAFPGGDTGGFIFDSGVQAMARGDLKVALDLMSEVIEDNPDFAEGWNKRATIHYMQGNYAESVSDIIQTLVLEPRHFGALSGLAQIYQRQEQYALALKVLDQLEVISPYSTGLDRWRDLLKQRLQDQAT